MKIFIGILLEILLVSGQQTQESYKSADNFCWLKPVLNGEVNFEGNLTDSLPVGGTVEVICADGFRLSNSRNQHVLLTCQADGSWTDSIHTVAFPTCDKIGGCSLPSITNGRVLSKLEGTYMPGDMTFIMCDLGHALSYSKSPYIICQHDGTWKGEFGNSLPSCDARQCGAPAPISHSTYTILNSVAFGFPLYPNGTQVFYSCDPGYVLQEDDSAIVSCHSGIWVGTERVHCISNGGLQTCTHPTNIVNGYNRLTFSDRMFATKYDDEIDAGTVAYVSCNRGYNLKGPQLRTCTDGKWIPSEPSSCVPIAQGCSQPPKIPYGNYTLGPSFTMNQEILPQDTVAYYSCKTGYKLAPDESSARLTCKGTEWTGSVPFCEFRVSCDKPMDVPDGSWYIVGSYMDFRRGSRVSYKCNDGFKLMGSSEIVCEVSGYWSDNAPKCLPKGKYCSDPGSVVNGFYVCKPNGCDNFRVGTEVHFMCSKGYEIEPVNLSVQTCQPGGYWSGYASSQLRCSYATTTPSQQQMQFLSEPSTLVVLIMTTCGILGLLLLVVIIVGVQRRMKRSVAVPLCPSDRREPISSVMIQPAIRRDQDRVALIAFPDIDTSSAVLPSYEEAVRSRTPGPRIARFGSELVHSSSIRSNRSDYRLLPHVGVSSISRIGTPGIQVREHSSQSSQDHRGGGDHRRNSIVTTASTMTRDNLSLAFGSVETVNVSDGTSTTVTIGTFESGGSNPSLAASQRAAAGSVGSPTEEDVPLLEAGSGGAGTLGRGTRQLMEAPPIPEEEHQDNI